MLRHYPRESQQQRGEMADETNTSVLLPIDIEAEMRKSYLDYAMSVIIARALPDVRDGLKPVQRRILVAMNDLGLASNRGYRKCAKICGDTSGNYHPHGEAVIYPAMVRLAQDFNMRYQLVDGQGNFGSVDGDPPAAMRTPKRGWRKFQKTFLPTWKRKPSISFPTSIRRAKSRLCCRHAFRICSSMARAASPSAWPRTSRRITCARSWTRRFC